jgi:hypothetical protein
MNGTILIRMTIAMLLTIGGGAVANAQNRVSSEGWEGFATRTPEDKLERCILYNRTIAALNSSPYDMLGLTRDPDGKVGLMIFYRPRTLTRSEHVGVTLKINDDQPVALTGEIPSDFHVTSAGVPTAVVSALRSARTIEATTEGHAIRFAVKGVDQALDALETCVQENSR